MFDSILENDDVREELDLGLSTSSPCTARSKGWQECGPYCLPSGETADAEARCDSRQGADGLDFDVLRGSRQRNGGEIWSHMRSLARQAVGRGRPVRGPVIQHVCGSDSDNGEHA